MTGRRLVLAATLALAMPAAAYDSRCYIGPGAECTPGPEAAAVRWTSSDAEHFQLFERAGDLAGVAGIHDLMTLQVFTGAPSSLQPVAFDSVRAVRTRPRQIGEFAELPDFSYSLWDWALGNETCPPRSSVPAVSCHDFKSHMGALNSNHFLPQAQRFYVYYHELAKARADECRTMRQGDGDQPRPGWRGADFDKYYEACRQEALVLEAVGQHFLQDAWSSGHMWERWGSPDYEPTIGWHRARMVAAVAGLIHGADALAGPMLLKHDLISSDAMCFPQPNVTWVTGDLTGPQRGVGDLYSHLLFDDPTFQPQQQRFMACSSAGILEVDRRTRARMPEAAPLDPESGRCFDQRATNFAIKAGAGLDFHDLLGLTQKHAVLDSDLAARVIFTQIGPDDSDWGDALTCREPFDHTCARELSIFRRSLVALASRIRRAPPIGSSLASGGIGMFYGSYPNSSYLPNPGDPTNPRTVLASYLDPPLPWPRPEPTPEGDEGATRALALARTFHRAHAREWCSRVDLDALRRKVDEAVTSGEAPRIEAACAVCAELAQRSLRVGNPSAYDTTRKPLCEVIGAASPSFVYQPAPPAGQTVDVGLLARQWCGRACAGSSLQVKLIADGTSCGTTHGGTAHIAADGPPPAMCTSTSVDSPVGTITQRVLAEGPAGYAIDVDVSGVGFASTRSEVSFTGAGTLTVTASPTWATAGNFLSVDLTIEDLSSGGQVYNGHAALFAGAAPTYPSFPIASPRTLRVSTGLSSNQIADAGSGRLLTLSFTPSP